MENDAGKATPITPPTELRPGSEIRFHYLKSPSFRVVHCDGAIGSLSPQGYIAAAIFSERIPIPQQTVQIIDANGAIGAENLGRRVQREGIVREVEVELIMNISTAENLAQWLLKHVEAIKEITRLQEAK